MTFPHAETDLTSMRVQRALGGDLGDGKADTPALGLEFLGEGGGEDLEGRGFWGCY